MAFNRSQIHNFIDILLEDTFGAVIQEKEHPGPQRMAEIIDKLIKENR